MAVAYYKTGRFAEAERPKPKPAALRVAPKKPRKPRKKQRPPKRAYNAKWNDEIEARLKVLWNDGYSASQCARLLYADFRVTFSRNAIVGKVHRLDLPRRPENGKNERRIKERTRQARQKKKPAPPPPPKPVEDIAHVKAKNGLPALFWLEDHQCKWPIGDPLDPDFGFCGCAQVAGTPYCEAHLFRAHNEVPNGNLVSCEKKTPPPVPTETASNATSVKQSFKGTKEFQEAE